MSRIGLIGGTALRDWERFEIDEAKEKKTPWGTPSSSLFKGELDSEDIILLMRHGKDHTIPPHRINHRANIYALQKEVDEVIGVCSAGALDKDMKVPSIAIPRDYVNFWNPVTFYNEKIRHVTPELCEDIREELIEASNLSNVEDTYPESVYVQTKGPRLETKAEVDILKNFGDLVGMTMGKEATLCKETNLDYAALVTVDNYSNGIRGKKVDYEDIVDTAEDNWEIVQDIIVRFLQRR